MSAPRLITRRRLAGLLASFACAVTSAAFADETDPRDQTSTDPATTLPKDKTLRDRGIGGTGVIGTIRRFGSIIVNGLRIAYPETVSVLIDGRRTTAADLRIGHVVQVVAHRRGEHLATSHIEVTSEVVGPVEFVSWPMITVLGQSVLADGLPSDPGIRRRDIVAVSGLRRVDGTIIASRIEHRHGSHRQVAGPVDIDASGVLRIGQLVVKDADPALAGGRAVLTGRLVRGVFRTISGRGDTALLHDSALRHFSIEAYVVRSAGGVTFGAGFMIPGSDTDAKIPESDELHVIADIQRDAGGHLDVGAVNGVSNGSPSMPGGSPAPDLPGNSPSRPNGPGSAPQKPGGPGGASQQPGGSSGGMGSSPGGPGSGGPGSHP